MSRWFAARWRAIASALILLWVGAHSLAGSILENRQRLRTGAVDPVESLDRDYRSLVAWLPARGRIGYLQPEDWPAADTVQRFYVAAYALAPRLVILGTDAEFVIVPPQSLSGPDGVAIDAPNPRLIGFTRVRTFDNGISIFRRG